MNGTVSPARTLLVILALMVSAMGSARAQTLQAYVDRTTIAANETVNFTLSVDQQVDPNSVDFSALYNDFRVFGVSPRSQTQIIDGRMSATTTWVVPLMPKKTGQLTIPSISVSGQDSDPIVLQVNDAPQSISSGAEIEVQVEPDRRQAFVNEQVLVTVRLIVPNQASDLRGEEFTVTGAESTLLGQQQFRRVDEGVAYQVVEWQYAVFASDTGTLQLPAQVFSVVVNDTTTRRFDPFSNQARRIIGSSEPMSIDILPPPEDSGPDWFPARDVQVSATWQNSDGSFRVGEPVTRSIVISSIGQKSSAIPPLEVANTDDFKVYADQPQMTDETSGLGVLGNRTESIALVPGAPGQLVLPAVVVRWWDIDQRRWKESELPAETIIVEPANLSAPPVAVPSATSDAGIDALLPPAPLAPQAQWWPGLSGALGIVALLLLLQNIRLRRRLTSQPEAGPADDKAGSEKEAWQRLRKAARSGQATRLRTAILDWAAENWPGAPVSTLESVGTVSGDTELRSLLAELDRSLYQEDVDGEIDYDRIVSLAGRNRRSGRRNKRDSGAPLPGLYLAEGQARR